MACAVCIHKKSRFIFLKLCILLQKKVFFPCSLISDGHLRIFILFPDPPSQAIVRYLPHRVVKKAAVTLYCSVDDPGRPEQTQFMWYRGTHVIQDVNTANWTISPVTLETESNFTCVAYNEGGQSAPGTVNIEVLGMFTFNQLLPIA